MPKKRRCRPPHYPPPLTLRQVLDWADLHKARTGHWPRIEEKPGDVIGAPGERWRNIDSARRQGCRGFPGGDSLARLLARKRGVPNKSDRPPLTEAMIAAWARAHFRARGAWPPPPHRAGGRSSGRDLEGYRQRPLRGRPWLGRRRYAVGPAGQALQGPHQGGRAPSELRAGLVLGRRPQDADGSVAAGGVGADPRCAGRDVVGGALGAAPGRAGPAGRHQPAEAIGQAPGRPTLSGPPAAVENGTDPALGRCPPPPDGALAGGAVGSGRWRRGGDVERHRYGPMPGPARFA